MKIHYMLPRGEIIKILLIQPIEFKHHLVTSKFLLISSNKTKSKDFNLQISIILLNNTLSQKKQTENKNCNFLKEI